MDLDFKDDLESVSDTESLLQSFENAIVLVGLYCLPELKSLSGTCIKSVKDFKYFGGYIMDHVEITSLGCSQQVGENRVQQHRQQYKRPALPIFN